jgi:hypothetical protein
MKRLLACLAPALGLAFAAPVSAEPLPYDRSWGNNGVVRFDHGNTATSGPGVYLVDSSGRYLAGLGVGGCSPTCRTYMRYYRFTPSGRLDRGWSKDGILTTKIRGDARSAFTPDGRLLTSDDSALHRFRSNGTVDTSFAGNGIAEGVPVGAWSLRSNGGVLTISHPDDLTFVPHLVTSSGALEHSGTPYTTATGGTISFYDSARVSSGFVAVGKNGADPVMYGLTPGGEIDAGFANGGELLLPQIGQTINLTHVIPLSGGRVLAAGSNGSQVVTLVVDSAGQPVPAFAGDGIRFFGSLDGVRDIQRTTNGFRMSATMGDDRSLAVLWVRPDGQLDSRYGDGGIKRMQIPPLPRYSGSVVGATFSPAGALFGATYLHEGTHRIWRGFKLPTNKVDAGARFSSDGWGQRGATLRVAAFNRGPEIARNSSLRLRLPSTVRVRAVDFNGRPCRTTRADGTTTVRCWLGSISSRGSRGGTITVQGDGSANATLHVSSSVSDYRRTNNTVTRRVVFGS